MTKKFYQTRIKQNEKLIQDLIKKPTAANLQQAELIGRQITYIKKLMKDAK